MRLPFHAVTLSTMPVPKLSQSFGHQTVPMPATAGEPAHLIDVIHLPGEDSVGREPDAAFGEREAAFLGRRPLLSGMSNSCAIFSNVPTETFFGHSSRA